MPKSTLRSSGRRPLQGLLILTMCLIFQPILAQENCFGLFDIQEGQTEAFTALEKGYVNQAAFLIREGLLDINMVDGGGNSYLRTTLWFKSEILLKALLQNENLVVEAKDLHFAYDHAPTALLRMLIEKTSVSLNGTDAYGNTILHSAVRERNEEAINLLLKQPAWRINISAINNRGETPSDIARGQLARMFQHPADRNYDSVIKSLNGILRNLSHPPLR